MSSFSSSLQLQYSKQKCLQLYAYVALLEEWRHRFNLIGKNEQIWERHIADCTWWILNLKDHLKEQSSIADIGTGAGLPGVVISILLGRRVTLVEAREKKCHFLKKVEQIPLPLQILNQRIETVNMQYDIITARALAPLLKLLELTQTMRKKESVCFFQKGKNVDQELKDAQQYFSFQVEKILSPLSGGGCVLIIRNIKKNEIS